MWCKMCVVIREAIFIFQDEAELERMNEAGELREMMEPLRDRAAVERVCVGCGGYRVVPCPGCGGSRVGSNMWHGSVKLRCTLCDMSGLVTLCCCILDSVPSHHVLGAEVTASLVALPPI